MVEKMKVRDLLPMQIDIDVVDNVTEQLYIAFCGPLRLTDEGARVFAQVLDYDVQKLSGSAGDICIIDCDGPEGFWQDKLRKAQKFFRSAAGYCTCDDYEKWFEDDEEDE